MKLKLIKLNKIFTFPSIKGLTEEFIRKHPGDIPVYGGRIHEEPVGYIENNLDGVKYFENCIAWNREGSVGYVFYHKHRFTTNDHHRPMYLKQKYKELIDLDYIRITLQDTLLSMGFEWSKTASKEIVSNLEIEIPVNAEDKFDIQVQKKLSKKHKKIEDIVKKLDEYNQLLKNTKVIYESGFPTKTVKLSDKKNFQLSIGKRLLKKDILKEGIPVYSANVYKCFGCTNASVLSDFSKPSLIWGIDGNFDWNLINANTAFAPTDHCGVLRINDKSIIPEYLLHVLRSDKDKYGFNRTYRASLKNIKADVEVEIPINENGEFDVSAQKTIIDRYNKINDIRNFLLEQLERASSSIVKVI